MPDSLLKAARCLASIAGLPWSETLARYRALQEATQNDPVAWLPKSSGRNVWYAHPNFMTRLMVGLAAADHASGAREAVSWVFATTPNGREHDLTEKPAAGLPYPIEREFFKYLTDEAAAESLDRVEFQPDTGSVIFHLYGFDPVIYSHPVAYRESAAEQTKLFRGIYSRGVIVGIVFVYIARTVVWRRSDEEPYRAAKQAEDEVLVDA